MSLEVVDRLRKDAEQLVQNISDLSGSLPRLVRDPGSLASATADVKMKSEKITKGLEEVFTDLPDGRKIVVPDLKSVEKFCEANQAPLGHVIAYMQINKFGFIHKVDLSYDGIIDVTGIGDLSALKILTLSGNSIDDINALAKLKELRELRLGYNDIRDISVVSHLSNLICLELEGGNLIEDLTPLKSCQKLRKLSFNYIPEIDLSFLTTMPNLREITIKGDRELIESDSIITQLSQANKIIEIEGRGLRIKVV